MINFGKSQSIFDDFLNHFEQIEEMKLKNKQMKSYKEVRAYSWEIGNTKYSRKNIEQLFANYFK